MNYFLHLFLRLGNITADKIFTGISKQIIEYQVALSQLAEAINSSSIPITYETVVTKIDEVLFPVHNSINLIECLSSTNNDPTWRLVMSRLVTKIFQTQSEHLYSNANIYCALHKILIQLDPAEKMKRGKSIYVKMFFKYGFNISINMLCKRRY